ncbi:MAG: hypothetical protein ACOYT8_05500 [Candidatus Dependentiae bacterium]
MKWCPRPKQGNALLMIILILSFLTTLGSYYMACLTLMHQNAYNQYTNQKIKHTLKEMAVNVIKLLLKNKNWPSKEYHLSIEKLERYNLPSGKLNLAIEQKNERVSCCLTYLTATTYQKIHYELLKDNDKILAKPIKL